MSFFIFFHAVLFFLVALKEQDPGETAIGDSETHTSRDELEYSLGNVKGEIAFPGDKAPGSRSAPEVTAVICRSKLKSRSRSAAAFFFPPTKQYRIERSEMSFD